MAATLSADDDEPENESEDSPEEPESEGGPVGGPVFGPRIQRARLITVGELSLDVVSGADESIAAIPLLCFLSADFRFVHLNLACQSL